MCLAAPPCRPAPIYPRRKITGGRRLNISCVGHGPRIRAQTAHTEERQPRPRHPPGVQGIPAPLPGTPHCSPQHAKFFRNPPRRGREIIRAGRAPRAAPLEVFSIIAPAQLGIRVWDMSQQGECAQALLASNNTHAISGGGCFSLPSRSPGAAPGRAGAARRYQGQAGTRTQHRPTRRPAAGAISCPGRPAPGGNVPEPGTAADPLPVISRAAVRARPCRRSGRPRPWARCCR